MSDDSSDENVENSSCILYKDRPEWKDVVPVEQDDGPDPIVAIDYSPVFKDAYDYFRAVVNQKEVSERALELTTTCISLNPANYSVWQYRRDLLKGLNKKLDEELNYSEKMILKQEKNYQVWQHRKVLVEWLKDPSKEKDLTAKALDKEDKNYHAWQHRQWVIKTFNLFDGELDYVDQLLNKDIRNNSAWNQRFFVIKNTTGFTPEVLDKEIDNTLNRLKELLENESAWNYLRGLLIHDENGMGKNEKIRKFCEEMYSKPENKSSVFLIALIVDICHELIGTPDEDPEYNLEKALKLCKELEEEHDTIRAKYWVHMAKIIQEKAETKS